MVADFCLLVILIHNTLQGDQYYMILFPVTGTVGASQQQSIHSISVEPLLIILHLHTVTHCCPGVVY